MQNAEIAMFVTGVTMATIRWSSYYGGQLLLVNKDVHSHSSNFIISFLLFLSACVIFKKRRTFCLFHFVGALLVFANIICETVLVSVNTTDWMDAVFGIAGSVIVWMYFVYDKTEVRKNTKTICPGEGNP